MATRRGNKPTTSNAVKKKSGNESNNDMQSRVTAALRKCKPNNEVHTLCMLYQPLYEDLHAAIDSIKADIHKALQNQFQYETYLYGSVITGMVFKTSDVDLYIKIHGPFDMTTIFKEVLYNIYHCHAFARITPIPKARIPIIKCLHKASGVAIDISFSSMSGVHTSYFVASVLYSDTRVHDLMIILKIWAEAHGITKEGCMTSHCLTLLLFFFLQVCEKPFIPSIKDMQQNADQVIVEYTNYGIDLSAFQTLNNDTLQEVLCKFFDFYANFDFENYLISPYLATAINRRDFENRSYLFPDYDRRMDFLNALHNIKQLPLGITHFPLNCSSFIVLQDPFTLNVNKAKQIGRKTYNHFILHLKNGHAICNDAIQNNQSFSELMLRLFYEPPKNVVTKKIRDKHVQKVSNNTFIIKLNAIESELFWVRSYLRRKYPNVIFDELEVKRVWCEQIITYIKKILTNIYKIAMDPLPHHNDKTKIQKRDNQTDVSSNTHIIYCRLTTNVNLWSSRKSLAKKSLSEFIKEQEKLTQQLEFERKHLKPIKMSCIFSAKPTEDCSVIEISIEDCTKLNEKSQLKTFYQELSLQARPFFRAYFEEFSKNVGN